MKVPVAHRSVKSDEDSRVRDLEKRLAEALGALDVAFSADELKRIEAAVPLGAAAGDRYDKWGMSMLDSERSSGEKSSSRGNAA